MATTEERRLTRYSKRASHHASTETVARRLGLAPSQLWSLHLVGFECERANRTTRMGRVWVAVAAVTSSSAPSVGNPGAVAARDPLSPLRSKSSELSRPEGHTRASHAESGR